MSCSALLQAQNNCIPPTVPQSTQLSYDQCFCASPFLTPFATTADAVCVTECTIPSDRQLLQAWYNGFCAKVAAGQDPTTETQTSSTVPTITTTLDQQTAGATLTGSSLTGTATPTPSSSSGNSGAVSSSSNQSWIQGHWKYILMLAILIIGLALLAWLAIWLKRRHRRNVEAKRAAASGFNYDSEKRSGKAVRQSAGPELWGPHQMMQATQGYGYSSEYVEEKPNRRESQKYRGADTKGLTREAMEVIDAERSVSTRPSTRRARPSELEINARMIGAADRRSKSRGKSSRRSDKESEAAAPELPRSKSLRKQRNLDQT